MRKRGVKSGAKEGVQSEAGGWRVRQGDGEPSCAKRSLMRVLSALSVVFQVSAQ